MTVREWLAEAEKVLGTEAARLETQVLLGQALGKDRPWLLAHASDIIANLSAANRLLDRRMAGEPLAYILGYREFYGRRFRVGPGVLIPRQETELLVEAAVEAVDRGLSRVLDLGSGSGAIGITVKLERPSAEVAASDVSPKAIEFTTANAKALDADIEAVLSDRFESMAGRRFDVIASNPPYISREEPLPFEVSHFEPEEALYAGDGGLEIYRWLSKQVRGHLYPGGEVWVEVGYRQAADVMGTFQQENWRFIEARKDLIGHDRVLGFAGT